MIYILQFSQPLGNRAAPRGQARYYMGYCEDDRLQERIAEHRAGAGAAITRAAVQRGINFDVVVTRPGSRDDERKLKRQKNTPRIVQQLLRAQVSP